ncbi:ribosomal protein S2 [Ceraceosorus guamensis]|uniref:Ribosomal protein S2 n=1 Tax=Ceraceosorus guamensis TaxID=1522189 RepID=A0A316VN70_9BASI|nr:ribosomal protein S2 [Ceraceosorus guamensis]PWN38760.1 ribosomal protein S2 [Ceraceosorus guamensis]
MASSLASTSSRGLLTTCSAHAHPLKSSRKAFEKSASARMMARLNGERCRSVSTQAAGLESAVGSEGPGAHSLAAEAQTPSSPRGALERTTQGQTEPQDAKLQVRSSRGAGQSDASLDAHKAELRRKALRSAAVDAMMPLTSTQTRQTGYRPVQARLSPVTARELTLSHLVAASAQVGHSRANTSRQAAQQVYGFRHDIAYIDLEKYTLPALRRAASVVRETTKRDGVVLFCGTAPGTQDAVLAAAKRLGRNGFHVTKSRWMPGVLTNAPNLLAKATLMGADHYSETLRDRAERKKERQSEGWTDKDEAELQSRLDLVRLSMRELQPDLLIVLNPKANLHAIREATSRGIPTIGVTDTDVDPRIVTYAIPANDESTRTAELVVGLLSKAGQEGLKDRELAQRVAERMVIQREAQRREQHRLTRESERIAREQAKAATAFGGRSIYGN